MDSAINTLHIQNFKSIRSALLHPRRVNLIIGQPNAGKSTVLEAMSLLGSVPYEQQDKFVGSFVRYDKPRQLFHDNLTGSPVRIETDRDLCLLGKSSQGPGYRYASFSQEAYRELRTQMGTPLAGGHLSRAGDDGALLDRLGPYLLRAGAPPTPGGYYYTELDKRGRPGLGAPAEARYLSSGSPWYPQAVKAYRFRSGGKLAVARPGSALFPPHGDNLVRVLETNADLRREFMGLFAAQGLSLRVRVDAGRLEITKELDGLSYAYPYQGTGDALRHYGFLLAVLESNRRAVLLLEEPEAHLYPDYATELVRRIVGGSGNQFFITTHSPHLFTQVIENMVPFENRALELAVFVAYYQDYQTKIRQLSDEELRNVQGDSAHAFRTLTRAATPDAVVMR
ncbi:AAA family ATPase [Hymenobacter nivis]|uniref:ATP-binding protein n=1 Tax=Hymenobacter nivis TaxID=1850093 RepID=A0A502H174_9BACT|nr:AAA family ATPase [Hymenobacter nivis]TPG67130.1 ATP-binding protein [Hymenobacter nivis]